MFVSILLPALLDESSVKTRSIFSSACWLELLSTESSLVSLSWKFSSRLLRLAGSEQYSPMCSPLSSKFSAFLRSLLFLLLLSTRLVLFGFSPDNWAFWLLFVLVLFENELPIFDLKLLLLLIPGLVLLQDDRLVLQHSCWCCCWWLFDRLCFVQYEKKLAHYICNYILLFPTIHSTFCKKIPN